MARAPPSRLCPTYSESWDLDSCPPETLLPNGYWSSLRYNQQVSDTAFQKTRGAQSRTRSLSCPMILLPLLLAGLALLGGCVSEPPGNPPVDQLEISWQVLSDASTQEQSFDSQLILENGSDQVLGDDWVIYFNYLHAIMPEASPTGTRIEHINGDYFRLLPEAGFRLERETEARIRFRSSGRPVNRSQGPAGFYLVYVDGAGEESSPHSIESRALPFPEGSIPDIPTPESRFRADENVGILALDSVTPVIPTPVSWRRSSRTVVLTPRFTIRYEPGLKPLASYLAEELEKVLGTTLSMETGDRASHDTILLRRDRVRVGRAVKGAGSEAYGLLVSPAVGIQIVGTDQAGIFYGIQTLRALFPADAHLRAQQQVSIPGFDIVDAPRFAHRGLHLDVARNFQKPETLTRLLDLMSFYKLNILHLHLSDDEGWRLEIPGLPELTGLGGQRGHTSNELDRLFPSFGSGPDPDPATSSGSGSYTREEFLRILRYAASRSIRVIPEIDLPGHARAAIKSMESRYHRLGENDPQAAEEFLLSDPGDSSQYLSAQSWSDNVVNVCRESTYRWFEVVVDELVKMYRDADLELNTLHVGGDEVPSGAWENSPECRALLSSGVEGGPAQRDQLLKYFLTRVKTLLRDRSVAVAGWEEAALALLEQAESASNPDGEEQAESKLIANVWRSGPDSGTAARLVEAGFTVVLSNSTHLYFDLAYEPDPEEPGLSWAGFANTRKTWEFPVLDEAHVLGIQGQLWSELLNTRERLEYMAFPKILALSERAWSRQPKWLSTDDPEQKSLLMEEDWERFANALGQVELPRLDHWAEGIGYRLPPPGAVVEEGFLKANSIFPGLTIRYALNGRRLTADSPIYHEPMPLSGSALLATFDTQGRASRSVAVP